MAMSKNIKNLRNLDDLQNLLDGYTNCNDLTKWSMLFINYGGQVTSLTPILYTIYVSGGCIYVFGFAFNF